MKTEQALDELVIVIKESSIYQNYTHILKQVEVNTDIESAIKNIKKLQKEIVKEQIKGKNIDQLEQQLDDKKNELYNIPLYQDYIEASEELNDLIKQVNNKLQDYLDGLDI